MLKELILEGQNRYYDCEICEDLTITPEDIERLCAKMKATAIRNTLTEGEKLKVKDVTQNVLISWGVLAEKDGAVVPGNAYALLTGQARFQPVIQCAVFKGKDRAYFVDRREFEGSIQDQMEAAFQYVLEKINRGMRIQGMYRQLPEKDWSHTDDTKRDTNDTISENDTKVLNLIRENPSITQAELKEKLQVSIVTVKRLMADLQKRGLIERQGSSRKGKWIIIGQKE